MKLRYSSVALWAESVVIAFCAGYLVGISSQKNGRESRLASGQLAAPKGSSESEQADSLSSGDRTKDRRVLRSSEARVRAFEVAACYETTSRTWAMQEADKFTAWVKAHPDHPQLHRILRGAWDGSIRSGQGQFTQQWAERIGNPTVTSILKTLTEDYERQKQNAGNATPIAR
jgi:hypothetical protein